MSSQTKIPAPDIILKLVETFEQNLDSYRSSKNETELRREFLDKFFAALGWDVANEKGYDEAHKEVVHEFSVETPEGGKKADYAFRTGTSFDFLVEAKKPSVRIESSQDAAFQIRRYGWSAKLPINILTDFEHFAVYDCRAKPNYGDKASVGRIMLLHYKEYAERWDEIASVFSPEAIRRGSLAKYAEGIKGKKGTADVDDAFLHEIERWRELLAKNIALRNPQIDIAGLNYAVQMIIDRIVFLRICEERGIEPENQLLDIAAPLVPPIFSERGKTSQTLNGENGGMSEGQGGREGVVYARLCELFKRADTKYNSGLFHFKKEKEQVSRPDDLTLSLTIDDKVLKDIISNLYYPKSPYAFLYIPADILGQVYERFLGKVIRLTAGHQAKVEEKPEVRKAGGVYYTPTYIVEYIVKNTVGKLLEGSRYGGDGRVVSAGDASRPAAYSTRRLTPADVAKLKIVDPACGSGTFLLGAYQYLLDWHLNWYVANDPEKWVKQNALAPAPSVPAGHLPHFPQENGGGRVGVGSYRLTTAKKKEILLNNIFGVDIDPQAVEVTKLSLLLKALEDASGQLTLGMERVLPDLGGNIKCGNSLIGSDYFEGQLLPDEEERARVNPFDWEREFPQVFDPHHPHRRSAAPSSNPKDLGEAGRGFDVVIGNPPYLKIEHIDEDSREYYSTHYKTFIKRYDTYGLFVELSKKLLKPTGLYGQIIPSTILNNLSFRNLRKFLLDNTTVRTIVNLGGRVFEGVNNDTLILIYENRRNETVSTQIYDVLIYGEKLGTAVLTGEKNLVIAAKEPDYLFELRVFGSVDAILSKMNRNSISLGNICNCFQGFVTGGNEAYIVDKTTINNKGLEKELCKPAVFGDEIARYKVPLPKNYVIYLTRETKLSHYPNVKAHLEPYKSKLETKREVKLGRQPWYSLHWARVQGNFERSPKILVQAIRNLSLKRRVVATLDENHLYADHTLNVLYKTHEQYHIYFVLGILNSCLINFLFSKKYIDINIKGVYLTDVPVPNINFSDPADKAAHDKMVSLVEQMLALHKSLAAAQSPAEKERLERQIEVTDRAIDALVYELYGLTEEEIKIVEGS